MKKLLFLAWLCLCVAGKAQNTWPKSYKQPAIYLGNIIEDNDHGFLATAFYNYDGNTWLLKFDANANLLWKKCLHYNKTPQFWATHFIKDRFKNLYLIGATWDTDTVSGDAFIMQLDSCYRKIKSVVYTDTLDKDQQYFGWSYDFSDSLLLIDGWGFNTFSSHLIFANKADLKPRVVYNTYFDTFANTLLKMGNAAYIAKTDYYYLINTTDTTSAAIRTALFKIDTATGNVLFYKFFGYNEDLLSMGHQAFRNKAGNLFVFSIFRDKLNEKVYPEFSPMVFECDTHGVMLNYKVFCDDKVLQGYESVLQYNDSLYFLACMYQSKDLPLGGAQQIKFYKLNAQANRIDSFYMNNFGRKYFTEHATYNVNLIRTFDDKIMCVFREYDSNLTNPRITFFKFDTNFKPDTTQYRNLVYDAGCGVMNDTITLAGSPIIELEADTTYSYIRLQRSVGVIEVPKGYRLAFYPNPVKEHATLCFENSKQDEVRIELYDAKGSFVNEMYRGNAAGSRQDNIGLSFQGLPAGMYYIKVYTANKLQHTVRCIKASE